MKKILILTLGMLTIITNVNASTVVVNAEEGFGCAKRNLDKIKNHITKMGWS